MHGACVLQSDVTGSIKLIATQCVVVQAGASIDMQQTVRARIVKRVGRSAQMHRKDPHWFR